MLIPLALAGVMGLAVGSFLNVVIFRLNTGGSPLKSRSHCDHCQKKLAWRDNIPLVSFFILKGRCRFCRLPISWHYPVVEALTAASFVFLTSGYWAIWSFSPQGGPELYMGVLEFSYSLLIASALIALFFSDLLYSTLPDKIVYPVIAVSLIGTWLSRSTELAWFTLQLTPAFLSAAFFASLTLFSRGRGMGLGDAKLAFLLGLILGFPKIMVALYAAFVLGSVVGLVLILTGRRKFGQTIPFGPFLIVGFLLALVFGEDILNFVIL